jgi:hypothetical protein
MKSEPFIWFLFYKNDGTCFGACGLFANELLLIFECRLFLLVIDVKLATSGLIEPEETKLEPIELLV